MNKLLCDATISDHTVVFDSIDSDYIVTTIVHDETMEEKRFNSFDTALKYYLDTLIKLIIKKLGGIREKNLSA